MFLSPRKRENTSHTRTIGLSKEMGRVEVGEGEGQSGLPASAVLKLFQLKNIQYTKISFFWELWVLNCIHLLINI